MDPFVRVRTTNAPNVVARGGTNVACCHARQQALDFSIGKSGATIESTSSARAYSSQLRVAHNEGKFYCMPGRDSFFSSHTGACVLLGDRKHRSARHMLRLGDILRMGSVGLVISEIRRSDTDSESLSTAQLRSLRAGASTSRVAYSRDGPTAEASVAEGTATGMGWPIADAASQDEGDTDWPNAADDTDTDGEDDELTVRGTSSTGIGASSTTVPQQRGKRALGALGPCCYICYDKHSAEDPLVSPCDCRGDTKYVHVKCLAKWNLTGQGQIFVRTQNLAGTASCSICKAPYNTNAPTLSGESISLMQTWKLPPPSISLVIITQHKQNPNLESMHYQISFSTLLQSRNRGGSDLSAARPLIIGRSSALCDVPIKYRTISGRHAKILMHNGSFYLEDCRSSNGTLLFMQAPKELPFNVPVHVKLGRTVVTLRAKRVRAWARLLRCALALAQKRRSSCFPARKASSSVVVPSRAATQ